MATSAILRVILGENSSRRLVLPLGLPVTVSELESEIKKQCLLQDPFRLQFMDEMFNNSFQNLSSMDEIQDRATVKVLSLRPVVAGTCDNALLIPTHPNSADADSTLMPSSQDSAVMSSTQDSSTPTRSSWPEVFPIPQFTYDAELKLDMANEVYRREGTRLIPDGKLKSDILKGLDQEILKYKVYFDKGGKDAEQVAHALIQKHPCLTESASTTGYSGWVKSIKYRAANTRTTLRKQGHREVCVNALKHKPEGKRSAAFAVKKPRKGEVAFCPSNMGGEDDDSQENMRVELLSDIKIRNNRERVKMKMKRTFPLRRYEVVSGDPMISEFTTRWPALFDVTEIDAEFKRITRMPLQSRFLSQLDMYSEDLLKLFESATGQKGKKLKEMTNVDTDDTDEGRDCIIKGLCIYLNEDPGDLVQEFIDVEETISEGALEKTTMGIIVIKNTSEDNVRIVLEGVTVVQDLDNVAFATAMLLGLIYALNLSYPPTLKCTFEVLQKIMMELDGGVLSHKAQSLKTKLNQQ